MTINIPNTSQKRLVIIGAGFAGLELARQMAKTKLQVVLIDKNNYHQFQPLFYQVAMAGLEPSSIAFPLRKTFQRYKNVHIRVTEVLEVIKETSEIVTALGTLRYDYLVIAIGADTNFFGNEKLAKKSISMKSVAEALYLRNSVLTDLELAVTETDFEKRQGYLDIVIVGGGATGVEVAGALAEMRNYILPKDYPELNCKEIDIYLIQSSSMLLKGMSDEASTSALKFLEDLNVKVILNNRVLDYDGEQVFMKDGTKIRSKKVIWAAGIIGNKLKGLSEDSLAWGNRIKVDRHSKVEGYENVFAIGDIAYMTEKAYEQGHPQVAQVAIQQAKHLVKNFQRQFKNKPFKDFYYKDKGSMATIGRHRAVVDLPRLKFQGFFAWIVWLAVHLFALIGVKNKLFVFINWVWNYVTYDQSLRLLIKPKIKNRGKEEVLE